MRTKTIMKLSFLFLLLTGCKGRKEAEVSEPYWLGADISFARSQEARGIQYKNKEGEPRECTALMKELGLNAISLRVWVNPKQF